MDMQAIICISIYICIYIYICNILHSAGSLEMLDLPPNRQWEESSAPNGSMRWLGTFSGSIWIRDN